MFPIDPNAPGGPDRSDFLRHSYPEHTVACERLPTLTFSQANPRHVASSVLSGRPTAAAPQSGTIPGAEPVPREAVNGIARSLRSDRSPFGSQGAVAA
jgi:hypothetical protein